MQLADDADQLSLQRGANDCVDRAERLVHQECPRAGSDRAGDSDALRLPARQLAGMPIPITRRIEPDELQQLVDAPRDLVAAPSEQRWNDRNVLRDRHVREEADGLNDVADAPPQLDGVYLGNVFLVDAYAARIERHEPIDGSQQRRLAAARGPEQHHELAAAALEGDVLDGIAIGVRIPNGGVLEPNGRGIHFVFLSEVEGSIERRNAAATSAGSCCERSTAAFILAAAWSVIAGETALSTRAICGRAANAALRTTGATL